MDNLVFTYFYFSPSEKFSYLYVKKQGQKRFFEILIDQRYCDKCSFLQAPRN